MTWLLILTYLLLALIIVVYLARLAKYARLPAHLRWELYPLAGERKRRWGGSYLEEPEWWSKPMEEKSFADEMKFMGKEVLFFEEYRKLNKPYWYFVYPFHTGIFLFTGFIALLVIGALTGIGGIAVSASTTNIWGVFLYYLTEVVGGAGIVMGTIGGISLFIRRFTSPDLKPYTRRIEYINLALITALFLTGLLSWAIFDPSFTLGREYVQSVLTFSGMAGMVPLVIAHILLVLLIVAYMPFTNMMHFFAKWFTYHKVRWDDAPNLRGSGLETKFGALMNSNLSWSSPHTTSFNHWKDIALEPTDAKLTPRVKKGATD